MVAEIKPAPSSQAKSESDRRGPRRPPERRVAIWGPLLVVLALALMLVAGIWRHIQQQHAQRQFAQQTGKVTVEVLDARRDQKPRDLLLPGNITAVQETTIFARANGYVARWLVDIGDNVKTGQLLAELETPELDKQLAAAEGTLKQGEANFDLARVTAQRWQNLAQKQVVAKQDNDERQGSYQAAAATLSSNKADVERLQDLQSFKKITAPFDGRITSRKVDVGSLISEGSGTTGTVLFTLAQIDPLRIFIDVPQSDSPLIEVGMDAKILVRERANRDFTGKVTRTAGALDPTSRTLRVEVQIPNHDGALFAGMYGQVKFVLADKNSPIVIPSDMFVFRTDGPQVAIVTNENKIHWQKIEVGRDFGNYLEVLKGIDENAHVVMNPTDDLTEGLAVESKPAQKQDEGAKPKEN
ncbi:MAG TPA: efflux RND transporter periplasmic adaptor subunit [Chthoniobacter sp.]|nr:efflux RND transporter periplasmic adaptor subunit [Chthoniobacter sp.]